MFSYGKKGVAFCAMLLFPLLWGLTFWGRATLTPPGWVAVCITLLPYLYLLLLLLYALLFGLTRQRRFLMLIGGLLLAGGLVWGSSLWPRRITPADHIEPVTVMVWNVQRLGEFVGSSQTECVARTIEAARPGLLALLEITSHQLLDLQARLNIPSHHCIWSDYYGTGRKRSGGLAICVTDPEDAWAISRKRTLDLPPNWKYLFLEVQTEQNPDWPPLNFLTLHIAPPKITDKRIENSVKALFRGEYHGVTEILNMLREYETQVKLQGTQAINALQLIQKFRDPTIIVGDFNSTRDAALHVHLREELIDAWSHAGFGIGATRYWGDVLPLRIDYIYVTKDFAVQDVAVPAAACSDHRPVLSSIFLHSPNSETKKVLSNRDYRE